MFQLQFMIEIPRSDLLTLPTKLHDALVPSDRCSNIEMRQYGALGIDGLTWNSHKRASELLDGHHGGCWNQEIKKPAEHIRFI